MPKKKPVQKPPQSVRIDESTAAKLAALSDKYPMISRNQLILLAIRHLHNCVEKQEESEIPFKGLIRDILGE